MIDPTIQQLLENIVDSPIKLQFILMFCEHPRLEMTATALAERAFRDIWSTRDALRELAEDGILMSIPGVGEPIYRFKPLPEYLDLLVRLYQTYNEPLARDELQRFVREVGSLARYFRTPASMFMTERL